MFTDSTCCISYGLAVFILSLLVQYTLGTPLTNREWGEARGILALVGLNSKISLLKSEISLQKGKPSPTSQIKKQTGTPQRGTASDKLVYFGFNNL